MPDESYESRHRGWMKNLRASLADEKDCLYHLHTPLGVINVSVWNYAVPGFVAVGGEDVPDKKYRFVVFSEEEYALFHLRSNERSWKPRKRRQGSSRRFKLIRKLNPRCVSGTV